jgi:hypothetical protein
VYVNPTYPLGLNYDYFISHSEIEEFGLTPYKAGSNKLQHNRIILNESSMAQITSLVSESFVPKYEELPNPVLDLCIISDLANQLRSRVFDFSMPYYAKYSDARTQSINLLKETLHEYF